MTVPLTLTLVPEPAAAATLRVRGEVDLTCADRLREVATTALARHNALTLDLSGAYFFDVAALRVLRAIHREATRLHRPTPTLRGVRPQLAKMLTLTGIDRLYAVETTTSHAASTTTPGLNGKTSHRPRTAALAH